MLDARDVTRVALYTNKSMKDELFGLAKEVATTYEDARSIEKERSNTCKGLNIADKCCPFNFRKSREVRTKEEMLQVYGEVSPCFEKILIGTSLQNKYDDHLPD